MIPRRIISSTPRVVRPMRRATSRLLMNGSTDSSLGAVVELCVFLLMSAVEKFKGGFAQNGGNFFLHRQVRLAPPGFNPRDFDLLEADPLRELQLRHALQHPRRLQSVIRRHFQFVVTVANRSPGYPLLKIAKRRQKKRASCYANPCRRMKCEILGNREENHEVTWRRRLASLSHFSSQLSALISSKSMIMSRISAG